MLQSILSAYSLVWVIHQQLRQDILDVLGAACRKKLLKADPFFGRKVDIHMSGLTLESIKHFLFRCSKDIVDPMYLIQLIFTRKKWLFGDELKQHASESPNIHFFIVVAVSHQALRRTIPPRRYIIRIRTRRMFTLT